jgi:hypothetical protein
MSAKALIGAVSITYVLIITAILYNSWATPVLEPKPTIYTAIQAMEQTGKINIPDLRETPYEKKKWALLRDIMTCESASKWEITPVPGYGYDVGPCQINTYWHSVKAARNGYDLYVPSQNIMYCIELFDQYYSAMREGGWHPWKATQTCWEARQHIRAETPTR